MMVDHKSGNLNAWQLLCIAIRFTFQLCRALVNSLDPDLDLLAYRARRLDQGIQLNRDVFRIHRPTG